MQLCIILVVSSLRSLVAGLAVRPRSSLLMVLAIVITMRCVRAESVVTSNRDGHVRLSPPSELVFEGMISYGNYKVFGAAENVKLYTSGVEFDREVWPRFLGSRVDYAMELLPVVLLSQPARTDFWGGALSRNRTIIPGFGITPIGLRLLWRDEHRIMPYFEVKGTVLGFTQKALSPQATYENWSFNLTQGVKIKLHDRYDLRLGLLSDLHFSNAFVVRSNPAVDVMNVEIGVVYHLTGRKVVR